MKAGIIIPARLGSTRLPRKVLADLGGQPLIVRTYQNACLAPGFDSVVVATDSDDVADAVQQAGGDVVRTASGHHTGTERIAEAVRFMDLDIVVNVQADEPFVEPRDIVTVADMLRQCQLVEMATLRHCLDDPAELKDPNVVKVVCTREGTALYFSRAPIPHNRDNGRIRCVYRHIGIYSYRRGFLIALAATTPSKIEQIENLEQLRALDMGARILVADAHGLPIGIDTRADLERARAFFPTWEARRRREKRQRTKGVVWGVRRDAWGMRRGAASLP